MAANDGVAERTSTGAVESARPRWLSPQWALFGLVLSIVATMLVAYGLARARIEEGIRHTLSSVALIKTEQLENWLGERRVETQLIVASPMFRADLRAWLAGQRDPAIAGRLKAHIQRTVVAGRITRLCLRSAVDGTPLLDDGCAADSQALQHKAVAAARTGSPVLDDFHLDEGEPSAVGVGLLYPLVLEENRPPQVVVDLAVDPRASLFPSLQQWPGGSPSAEVLLVRRDGNDVLFLNTLRFRDEPPLTFRRPLTDGTLLAAQAVSGRIGLARGADYRGVPSVGYVMPVAGTPWFLIAKMDRSEAETWLNRLGILVAAALLVVVATGLKWWNERQRFVAKLHAGDLARVVLSERMEYLRGQTHDCILLVGLSGKVLEINERCAGIYGYTVEEMLARDGRELLAAVQPDGNLAALWTRLSADGNLILDTEQSRKDGTPVVVEISMRAFILCDSRCIQAVVRDITERKRAEARIEDLYQNAPCGYHSIDAEGRFCLINDTELAWLGYRREELVGRKLITDLLTNASRAHFERTFPVMRKLGFVHDLELDFVCRDGRTMPTLINATAIYAADGSFVMTRSMMLNMTERKAMERERDQQAAELAEISHRLVSVQEDERRRLSAELHDRTSPNLAALDINLRSLARRLPTLPDGEAGMLLDDATALLADTANSIREVCADLRPPILDYAGLASALQSYALQFSARTGVAVDLEGPGLARRFAAEIESTLFRIAQEALTNCAKHAGAGKVNLRIDVGERGIVMEIVDDGVGFSADHLADFGNPGLGLLSMRERARFAGGDLRIVSRPGSGTRLVVTLPLAGERSHVPERRRHGTAPATPALATADAGSVDSNYEG